MRRQNNHASISRLQAIWERYFAVLLLVGCVQGDIPPTTKAPSTVNSSNLADIQSAQTIRIMVIFNQSMTFNSDVLLREMRSMTQAHFSYIAPVSGMAHVYGVQPFSGQTLDQVLQRLANMPAVSRIEVDQTMKVQQ